MLNRVSYIKIITNENKKNSLNFVVYSCDYRLKSLKVRQIINPILTKKKNKNIYKIKLSINKSMYRYNLPIKKSTNH